MWTDDRKRVAPPTWRAGLVAVGLLVALTAGVAALRSAGRGVVRAAPAGPRTTTTVPTPATAAVPVILQVHADPYGAGAELTWRWPTTVPATRFIVVALPGGANATVDGDARGASVVGLLPGTYRFTVFADTPAGRSQASAPSEPIGITDRGATETSLDLRRRPPLASGPRLADCTASQVEMRFIRSEVEAENATGGLVEIRNTSPDGCTIEGYPDMRMLDADGAEIYTMGGPEPGMGWQVPVTLPAGTRAISASRPAPGHAHFWMIWTGRAGCLHASGNPSRLRIGVPINASSLDISAVALDRSRISACQSGLSVGPFEAAR